MITRLYASMKQHKQTKNGQKDKAIPGQEAEVPRFQDSRHMREESLPPAAVGG
jgi:hypothetical protein